MEQRESNLSREKEAAEEGDKWPKSIGTLLNELELPENMLNGESVIAKKQQERKAQAQKKREDAVELAENALKTLDDELSKGKSETLIQFLSTM